jgi:translation initiation factor 1 (eIF-1/SUI1)
MFNCNGSVKTNEKTKEDYIELTGDHRDEVRKFLIHEGIGTEEFIKMHGTEILS